jgi:hypothetical protein
MRIASLAGLPRSCATSWRMTACASAAISGVAVLPVPMAHTGSYAMTMGAACVASMFSNARLVWRRNTASVSPLSRCSSCSPTQTIGTSLWRSAARSFLFTSSSVSPKYWRRSEWPIST